ncbi:MAG: hypothetical protein Q7S56_01320 [Nanoarchaeota archaeon]|nr:hypothetical protein [Nanoarchaeota archaeon]
MAKVIDMAEMERPDYGAEMKKYAYGAIAGRHIEQKDPRGAQISLEKLASKDGLNLGKDLEAFVKGTYASKEGIQTASIISANNYGKAMANSTASKLWDFYKDIRGKYIGEEEKERVETEVERFKDVNYGEIKKKMEAAEEILKSKTDNFTKEQKEKAKKELEKYQKIYILFATLNDAYLGKYESNVEEEHRRRLLQETFKEEREDLAEAA